MNVLSIRAPLGGWSLPLADVPDPVFAGGMMGEGVAIDPVDGVLRAPCDAVVSSVAAASHAVTLRATNGAELLLHVGIDTVALRGEGFEPLVTAGQSVLTGEPLLRFDLDLVARRAASLVTPLAVVNAADFALSGLAVGQRVAHGDVLFELRAKPVAATELETAASATTHGESRTLRVELAHGIHARPAALIARLSRGIAAPIEFRAHGRCADARSSVSLLALGVRHGDVVEIAARGPDARRAIAELAEMLVAHEPARAAVPARPGPTPAPATPVAGLPATVPPDGVLHGVIAARGFAVGTVHRIERRERAIVETGAGAEVETAALARARDEVRARLKRLAAQSTGARREIAEAHLEFLDDPVFDVHTSRGLARGASAAAAWRQAVRAQTDALRAVDDERLRERVDDLLDLETQVLDMLAGDGAQGPGIPDGAVIVASELLPSQFAALDATRVAALCLAQGGPTSHVAIMAAAMGLPTLVSLGPAMATVADGTPLIVDAERGLVRVDPPREMVEDARRTVRARREREETERAGANADCRTADGTRIEVFANVGSLAEAAHAVQQGAEGCGLLRTEFLFLDRQAAPDEAEQRAEYQRIVDAFGGRPVVIRTLDVGGDKPIDYLPLPHEDNPALGLRGVRTSLRRPDLLRTQLQAILAVSPRGRCRIMLPMITEPGELRQVRTLLDEIAAEQQPPRQVELGVMVETPAAALMAGQICEIADFVSIGTNDLTQYTLAMDRTNPELARRLDGLHPAVLRLVARTAEAARLRGRLVAVCGGLASDPAAARLLVGLGVQELSAVPAAIPRLKAEIRGVTVDECRKLAHAALEMDSAAAVRALIAASVGAV